MANLRVTDTDGSQWVNAESYDELLAVLRDLLWDYEGLSDETLQSRADEGGDTARIWKAAIAARGAVAKAEPA